MSKHLGEKCGKLGLMDGNPDGRTDGRTDITIPQYVPSGIKRVLIDCSVVLLLVTIPYQACVVNVPSETLDVLDAPPPLSPKIVNFLEYQASSV